MTDKSTDVTQGGQDQLEDIFSFGPEVTNFDADDKKENELPDICSQIQDLNIRQAIDMRQPREEKLVHTLHGIFIDNENLPQCLGSYPCQIKTVGLDAKTVKPPLSPTSKMDSFIDKRDVQEIYHSRLTKHKNDLVRNDDTEFLVANL